MTQQPHFGRLWDYRFTHDGAEIHRGDLGDDDEALSLRVSLRSDHHLAGDLVIDRANKGGWRRVATQTGVQE